MARFWQDAARKKVSRRRVLKGAALSAAGIAGAAAFACAGDEEGGTPGVPPSPTPSEEQEPVIGGMGNGTMADLYNMDPHKPIAFLTHVFGSWTYNRLMRFATQRGILPDELWYEPVPELAQKIENPEPLTFIFTLHPEARWHDIDPVFGREVTAEDVIYNYERFRNLSPNKDDWAMVDSVTASPDTKQITIKLKHPYGLFLKRVASFNDLWLVAPELIEKDGDAEKRAVGSGPFIFEHYRRSVDFLWRKNPDYFEKDKWGNRLPYLDGLHLYVIPDPNTVMSQFLAKKLDATYVQAALLNDIRAQAPEARINKNLRNLTSFLYFEPASYTENKPPFNDIRVRRAISMAIDRDGLLKLISPEEGGEWPNIISAGMGRKWWVDPKSEEMGEPGKWYRYDPAEAKALLKAAGYEDGFECRFHYSSTVYTNIITYYPVVAEALPGLMREVDIRLTSVPEDYIGQYFPQTYSQGNFDGMAWGLLTVLPDAAGYIEMSYLPWGKGGARNMSRVDDPELVRNITDAVQTWDVDEVCQKLRQIQKYVSDKMYYVPGVNPYEYSASWPVGGGGVNTSGPTTYSFGTEGTMWAWRYKGM
ncbi:MAG: ABC transporter substrate-binding protein [Dehalococcoidia bacterium]|nr:ABC transporter substrate-binding protein [Dehalococcoidia bacterium]